MACSSLSTAPSPLWTHFLLIDVTQTFHPLFAPKLSTVRDRLVFAEQLALLMRQWRGIRWDDIFMDRKKRVPKKRLATRGAMESEESEESQRQCELAMYYESIRVQRLMDTLLYPQMDDTCRRRRVLLRAIDAVWRHASEVGMDFLLPVTESEAPMYYRHIKQPVCVASLYCAVWDARIDSCADLKGLLALMRSNCESYNGPSHALMRTCQDVVKYGYNAARDAQADESVEEADWSQPALAAEELRVIFPPNMKARNGATAPPVIAEAEVKTEPTERKRLFSLIRRRTGTEDGNAEASQSGRRIIRLVTSTALKRANKEGGEDRDQNNHSHNESHNTNNNNKVVKNGLEHAEGEKVSNSNTQTERPKRGRKPKKKESETVEDDKEKVSNDTVRCHLCNALRVLPKGILEVPEYWDCSFIKKRCEAAGTKKAKNMEKKTRNVVQRVGNASKIGVIKKRETRGKRPRQNVDANEDEEDDDEDVISRAYASLVQPTRRRKPLAKATTSSSSSSSSSASSTDGSSSSGSSSSSSDSSSDDNEGEMNEKRSPRRGENSTKKGKPRKVGNAGRLIPSKHNTVTKKTVTSEKPAPFELTEKDLTELEEMMDRIEAMSVQQKSTEILGEIKKIERALPPEME